jgi:alanyl-tRNA synthetase
VAQTSGLVAVRGDWPLSLLWLPETRRPLSSPSMTDHLYYHDSFLHEFDAEVRVVTGGPRVAVVLDRTAFYPTSGGQPFDTGWITVGDDRDAAHELRVVDVTESEDGAVVHHVEPSSGGWDVGSIVPGTRVRGRIDAARRRDHVQQHSAQHVLSAAFDRLFGMRTVSFHLGVEYSSIDLDTPGLTAAQVEAAERVVNEVVVEDRPVEIRFVTRAQAGSLGLRKDPVAERDELRIIDIEDFDRSACGGTHVRRTGQIGCVLLRKTEKVRHGWRVEFVAGQRAVRTARLDFGVLTEAAALFSAAFTEIPQQARRVADEARSLRKEREQLQSELAVAQAAAMLAESPENQAHRVVGRVFADRDVNALKLLAQALTRRAPNVVALLASTSPQGSLVFAQSPGGPFDMRVLMKEAVTQLGGRGGGTKDIAQGGAPSGEGMDAALAAAARTLAEAAR